MPEQLVGTNILSEAHAIIYGDREKTYGSPAKNLETIAAYWTAHLRARGFMVDSAVLSADDVAIMMTGLKLARLANDAAHRDSQVDACGYLALMERIQSSNAKFNGGLYPVRCNAELEIAATTEKGSSMEWKPIETAPKDRKAKLVFCPENKCIFCVSLDLIDGSWIHFGGGGTLFYEPTHWMPLPESPNAEVSGLRSKSA